MALKLPTLDTCLRFSIMAYNVQVKDEYSAKVNLSIYALSEEEAIEKAKLILTRREYEVYDVNEIIDVVKD